MIALYILLGSFGSLFILWLLWIVVMGLSRARDEGRLAPSTIRVGKFVGYAALVWDVFCNMLPCTLFFLQLPHEPTLSQRLRRLVMTAGWRSKLATWVAVELVNPFSVDRNSPHIQLPKV